jgi:transglutaminase-like putative cysteine protease
VEAVHREAVDPQFQGKLLLSHFKWVKKNEPALTPEPYIGSLKNYEDRVSLLHLWRLRDFTTYKSYTSDTWEGFSHIYYFIEGIEDFEHDKFGWMKKDLEQITAGLQTKSEISLAVFKYVRDHFSCTSHNDYFLSQKLKETFRDKSGNVADLNLLLTAMLKQMNIDAYPALLATLDRGVGSLSQPLPNDYNYLICVADLDGRQVPLDASRPLNPYGKLPSYCYNGGAVTLDTKKPRLISLMPDSLQEQNRVNVIMTSDDKGVLSGNLTLNCGYQMSYELRENIKKTSVEKYLNSNIKNHIARFSNEEVQALKDPDKPLTISSDIDFADSVKSDLCYISPVIFSYFEKNPFIAIKRKFIVEMPSRIDDIYLLSLDVPKGYTVDEMPASRKITLNDKDGYFEYLLEKNGDIIQLQMRIKINKTFFTTEEYGNLREFFSQVITKENEQIVFRKLKS